MSRVVVPDTPCRLWQGHCNPNGYGTYSIKGRAHYVLIHRWVWEQINGPIPEGVEIMHACDNKPCFRYDHLVAGTRHDTAMLMVARGRHECQTRYVTHCPHGHPYDEENTYRHDGKRQCRTCRRARSNVGRRRRR